MKQMLLLNTASLIQKKMEDVLLHNSARLHTSLQTVEVITKLHWTLLPYPYHASWFWPHHISIFLAHCRMPVTDER
jgi:hypothetical protein